MSSFTHHRARVAALARHGAAAEVIDAARRDLDAARRDKAAEETLREINARRAAFGLAPLNDPVTGALTRALFLDDREAA